MAIRTAQWERSIAFWCDGMGFSLAVAWGEEPRRACLLDTGDGNYLEIFERDPEPAPAVESALLHLCLRTDDCDAALARAREAGAEVMSEATSLAVFGDPPIPIRIAFIKDPNGVVCEFFQNDAL